MAINHEFEKRVMLSEKEYFKILNDIKNSFPNTPFIYQKNRYFDTDDFLISNKHSTLRIRSYFPDKREITLKVKDQDCDLEINEPLSLFWLRQIIDSHRFPDNQVKTKLLELNIDINKINFLGILETRRLEISYSTHTLVLDVNNYLGVSDYDLEVEASSLQEAEKYIQVYCNKYNLTYKKDYLSKSRRFLKRLKKENN